LPAWRPQGGVHLVLKIGDEVIQPSAKRGARADAVSVLPQEHDEIKTQGDAVTYTPLYRSVFRERTSQRAWFTFSGLSDGPEHITVMVISCSGKTKEKELTQPYSSTEPPRDCSR
jgi:hypothetical protein